MIYVWMYLHYSLWSVRFILKNLKLLFTKDAFNCSKVTVKTFIMLQKIVFQINAVLLNFFFHQRILRNKT